MTKKFKNDLEAKNNVNPELYSIAYKESLEMNASEISDPKRDCFVPVQKLQSSLVYSHKFYKPVSKL